MRGSNLQRTGAGGERRVDPDGPGLAFDSAKHLVCACPMQLEIALAGQLVDPAKYLTKATGLCRCAEQSIGVVLARAVRVELDEGILTDLRGMVDPQTDTVAGRKVVGSDLTHLDAGSEPPTEAQGHRAGDHQQIALAARAGTASMPLLKDLGRGVCDAQ